MSDTEPQGLTEKLEAFFDSGGRTMFVAALKAVAEKPAPDEKLEPAVRLSSVERFEADKIAILAAQKAEMERQGVAKQSEIVPSNNGAYASSGDEPKAKEIPNEATRNDPDYVADDRIDGEQLSRKQVHGGGGGSSSNKRKQVKKGTKTCPVHHLEYCQCLQGKTSNLGKPRTLYLAKDFADFLAASPDVCVRDIVQFLVATQHTMPAHSGNPSSWLYTLRSRGRSRGIGKGRPPKVSGEAGIARKERFPDPLVAQIKRLFGIDGNWRGEDALVTLSDLAHIAFEIYRGRQLQYQRVINKIATPDLGTTVSEIVQIEAWLLNNPDAFAQYLAC
jgi:hypothetical protein